MSEAEVSHDLDEAIEIDVRQKLLSSIYVKARGNFFLGVTCIILGLGVTLKSFEVHPVHVVPGADKAGEAFRNQVPLDVASRFARDFLTSYYNYGPGNVEDVLDGVYPKVSPKIQANFKSKMAKRISDIKDSGIEQQLILLGGVEESYKVPGKNIYVVLQKGVLRQWVMGGVAIKNQQLIYEVVVEQGVPTSKNSYGLYIFSDDSMDYNEYVAKKQGEGDGVEEGIDASLDALDKQ